MTCWVVVIKWLQELCAVSASDGLLANKLYENRHTEIGVCPKGDFELHSWSSCIKYY
jgi:hypothetical protein